MVEDVAACPALPDYTQFFSEVPPLGRRLRIACPCIGIDGCGHALEVMKVPTDVLNAYDLQDMYVGALSRHLAEMGMETIRLNLGPESGDILKVPLENLAKPIDYLVSGPPCPPWAGQGKHRGCKDSRAHVFLRVIAWVAYLALTGGLLGCILENVIGILHQTSDGHEPVAAKFVRVLSKHIPFFTWRVDKLELVDYQSPQTRVRVFIRGMRKIIGDCVPSPLPPWGRRGLRETLGKLPCTPRSSLTAPQQENLLDFEDKVRQLHSQGRLSLDSIVVCPVDRSHEETIQYEAKLTVDSCPTLTTHNSYLFVLSVRDIIHNVEDNQREYFGKLTGPVRLALQGFPPSLALDLPEGKITFAAGNAYPIPLLVAVFQPMLAALALSDVSLATWPPADMVTTVMPDLSGLIRGLNAAGKIVNREKYERAQHKQRKQRRARSDSD